MLNGSVNIQKMPICTRI